LSRGVRLNQDQRTDNEERELESEPQVYLAPSCTLAPLSRFTIP
jgi:hypothetical protein